MQPKLSASLFAVSIVGLVSSAVSTFGAGSQSENEFKRYKAVEAYEIRPGVLMMPRYDSTGQVCQIGLEKLHYSPEVIRQGSSWSAKSVRHGADWSRNEINELVAELAPDRGGGLDHEESLLDGDRIITTFGYENVTVEIHMWQQKSSQKDSAGEQDAVVIRWNYRPCWR
jgi:hypothetical protein